MGLLKHKSLITLTFLLVTAFLLNNTAVHATNLIITLETDKEAYGSGEIATIKGNLTLEGYGFRVGLVAVEIDSPFKPFVFKTMQTGPIENPQWEIEITNLYPCNQSGYPKYSFKPGTFAYVKVEYTNYSNSSKPIAVAIYMQYSNNVPFIAKLDKTEIPASTSGSMLSSIPIPSSAPLGTTWVFASIYTDWPKYGGLPYCPEKNATFTISTSSSSYQTSQTNLYATLEDSPSSFTIKFTLPRGTDCTFGNYTIYASAKWQNYTATNTKIFQVVLVGDVDGNGTVDMDDIGLAALAYGTKPGDSRWDPRADINNDGIIDMDDIGLICLHYGEHI